MNFISDLCGNKLKTVFASLLLVLSLNCIAATKNVTIDKIKYSINTTDKKAQVKGRSEEASKNWKLTIPDELLTEWGTIKVTSIASSAFSYDSYLTSVSCANTIETIGSNAFFGCSNLKSVYLGSKLSILGYRAFSNTGLTSVELPASLTIIRDEVFMASKKLQSVTFDRNTSKLESIGASAFWQTGIENLILPGCIKTIGEDAFEDCQSLVSVSFLAGSGQTAIGDGCFNNNKKLAKVTFGNPGVASIGQDAFIGCAITNVSFPASLRSIGDGAFCGNNLTGLNFAEGISSIGSFAFNDQTPNIPGGMNSLDKLTTLDLPASLKSIGKEAFLGVSRDLISVTSKAAVPPVAMESAFDHTTLDNAHLIVPAASLAAYSSANVWKDFLTIRAIGSTAVEAIDDDNSNEPTKYFTLSGIPVSAEMLSPGIYICKKGNKVSKTVIK